MKDKIMKKQYLISLLGLVAIFLPMGHGLLDTNIDKLVTPIVEPTPDTGLTINGTSSVSVFDTSKLQEDGTPDGIVSEGDSLAAIDVTIDYKADENNDDYSYLKDDIVHVYAAGTDEELKKDGWKAEDIKQGEINKSGDVITSLALNLDFDPETDMNKESPPSPTGIWKYTLDENSINGFDVRLTTSKNDFTEPVTIDLGSINKINSPIDNSKPYYIKETGNVVVRKKQSSVNKNKSEIDDQYEAEVNYKIIRGKNINGYQETIKEVKWMNGTDELASSENLDPNSSRIINGSLIADIEPYTDYSGTTLEAVTNDDNHVLISEPIETFSTSARPSGNVVNKVIVDESNGILEVKGDIISNGSNIKEVNITKNIGTVEAPEWEPLETTTIILEPSEDNTKVSYDVWTSEYEVIDEEQNLDNYSLEVVFSLNEMDDEFYPWITDEPTSYDTMDLSYLTKTSNKLGAGAIIGIIIAVIILIIPFVWIGTLFYKKYSPIKE